MQRRVKPRKAPRPLSVKVFERLFTSGCASGDSEYGRSGRSDQSENSWIVSRPENSVETRNRRVSVKIATKLDYLSLANNSLKRGWSRKIS